jgi:Skp family chaperone for outer membrane proteins
MFGLSGIGLKIAIAAIGISLIFSAWFYVKSLQSEIQAAHEVRARLEDNIKAQETAMTAMREDVARQAAIQRALSDSLNSAQQANADLNRRFSQDSSGRERNFTTFTTQQPSAVEQRANRGTRDALRCNEIVTGSPLTEDERTGKVINNICPQLLPPRQPAQATR